MENYFFNTKKKLYDEDIKNFERSNNITIPLKIRNHYLKFNGGYPERNVFCAEDERKYSINYFYSLVCGEGLAIEKILPMLRDEKVFPKWLVPLANDDGGNIFAYSIRNDDEGAIYYYSHEFEYGEKPENYVTYLSKDIDVFFGFIRI